MNILQRIGKIWGWLKGGFETTAVNAAHIAVTITEHVKVALDSGVAGFLASLFDNLTKTNVGADIISTLKKAVPEALAAELAVVGLPADPTEADILAFEKRILDAFHIIDSHSKLYTVFAAQVYGIVHTMANKGAIVNFYDCAQAVEDAYSDYQDDLRDAA